MSSVYGYSQSLSEGSAFNARVAAHNDLVKEHNNKVLGDYHTAVKQQTRDAADDKDTVEEDAAIDGTEDGKGLLQAAYGSYKFGQDIGTAGGVGAAFAKQSAERQGAIKSTFKRLGDGEVKKAAKTDLSSAAGDSEAAEGAANDAADAGDAAAGTSAAAGDAAAATRTASAAGAATTAAGDTAGAAGTAAGDAAAAGTAAEDVAGAAGDAAGAAGAAGEVTEIGSSGLGAAVIKGGLAKLGVGKLVGEAGLSTLSEVGGKAAGDFGGIVDAGEGIANLADGKNFFGNDDTAKKWGDSFQMAGAAMDVVGTAFPPLELLGGATGLLGGIIDGIDGLSKDEKKKQSDAAPITDPTKDPSGAGIQQMQVSPAFQSMGLIASAPVSAKMSITGSSGAF
tara:strand:+ start:50 stop:1231 length:1182 start_codon:yes stop_codon:yes gene_type:complete